MSSATYTHVVDLTKSVSAIKNADKASIINGLVKDDDEYCPYKSDEENNGYPSLTYLVEITPDKEACIADKDALSLPSTVSGSFMLTTAGENGTVISWQSNNTDIIRIKGSTADVLAGDSDIEVALTATITKGDAVEYRRFIVVVKRLVEIQVKSEEIVVTDNGNGTSTASLSVEYSGLIERYTTIKYIVIIRDENGNIIAKRYEEKPVMTSPTVKETFSVNNLPTPTVTQTLEYFLWGDGKVPIIDHGPTKVNNLSVSPKAKNITLTWDKCYDDSGVLVEYLIYRDGILVGKTNDNEYKAPASTSTASSYSVVPVDNNNNKGLGSTSEASKAMVMYHITPTGSNGMTMIPSYPPNGDSYYIISQVNRDGKHNVYTTDRIAKDSRIYVKVNTALTGITVDTRNLVIEVDYWCDGEDDFGIEYVSTVGDRKRIEFSTSQGVWRTAVFRLYDAAFRDSDTPSGGHFCVRLPATANPESMFIRAIRIIQAEYYD